jgi:hypothetical protein
MFASYWVAKKIGNFFLTRQQSKHELCFNGAAKKTVDFATAASQNGVCITQGKCHK